MEGGGGGKVTLAQLLHDALQACNHIAMVIIRTPVNFIVYLLVIFFRNVRLKMLKNVQVLHLKVGFSMQK